MTTAKKAVPSILILCAVCLAGATALAQSSGASGNSDQAQAYGSNQPQSNGNSQAGSTGNGQTSTSAGQANSSSNNAPSQSSGGVLPPVVTYVSPVNNNRLGAAAGEKGFTFYEFYGGSATSAGYITTLETTVGYDFNRHFGIDVGVPLYILGASANKVLNTPAGQPFSASFSEAGLGDVYTDLLLTLPSTAVNYLGSVRLGAPTGSTRKGLGTGHVTFDWENYFDHDFGRLRPYVDAGFANSILDTHFLYRPFETYGFVVLSEAGASVELAPPLRVGASFYDDAPIGPQVIFRRPGGREVRGPARIDQDHGASVWATVQPTSLLIFEVGYDRSIVYHLNSFSFGIMFDVAGAYRKLRGAR